MAVASGKRLMELDAAFFTLALSDRYPGIVVGSAEPVDLVAGTNTRARVKLSYERGTGPPSVFVKAPGRLLHRLALSVLGALDAEARLALSGLQLPLEHADLLGAELGRGWQGSVVVLEDLSLRGGSPNSPRMPLTPQQVEDGLVGLAHLHGSYLDRPFPPGLDFVSPWRLGGLWAAVSGPSLVRAKRRLDRLGRTIGFPVVAGPQLLERQFRASARLAATGPQTLLHGDPHPGNTFSLKGERTGFYDWQLVRSGHFSHDLSYFLAGSLTPEDRRQHERALIETYLDALGATGASPPSVAETWERYRASPAFGLCTWLHTLSAGSFQDEVDCLAMIERFSSAYDDLGTARLL